MYSAALFSVFLALPVIALSGDIQPDAPVSSCGLYETECKFFCCPYASGSCCWDGMGCCPNGKTCIGIFGVGVCVGYGPERKGRRTIVSEIPAGPKYEGSALKKKDGSERMCPDEIHSCPRDKECCTAIDGSVSCCDK